MHTDIDWINQLDSVSDSHGGKCEEGYSQECAEGGDEFPLPGLRHHVAVSHRAQRDLRQCTIS